MALETIRLGGTAIDGAEAAILLTLTYCRSEREGLRAEVSKLRRIRPRSTKAHQYLRADIRLVSSGAISPAQAWRVQTDGRIDFCDECCNNGNTIAKVDRQSPQMDWMTFISSIVSSSAWPLSMLAVIVLLRTEIKSLFKLVTKIKAGPVEAEFEREMDELKRQADLASPPTQTSEKLSVADQEIIQLASINPRSAILEAWRLLEVAAEKSLEKKGKRLNDSERTSIVSVVRELSANQILSQEEVSILHELRALRNDAVHAKDFNPTESSVVNYLTLARRLKLKMADN